MKNILWYSICLLFGVQQVVAQIVSIKSPDDKIVLNIKSDNGQLLFNVKRERALYWKIHLWPFLLMKRNL